MIDFFKRYQVGLKLKDLYPLKNDGLCDCGCGKEKKKKKKRWASFECQNNALINFWIIKGDTNIIRQSIFEIEGGFCRSCGIFSDNWHVDHINPVFLGGSACGLDNFQTLCVDCHKAKTYADSHALTISSHAACMLDNRRATAFGAVSCEFPKQSIDMHILGSANSVFDIKFASVY